MSIQTCIQWLNRQHAIFYVILAVGVFLRVYLIGQVPPAPSLDEISIGYNAQSILMTGRDEYGYRTPILLRAYDDWRPAGYVYLVMPFVYVLGMTAVAVRLPSIIMAMASMIVMYRLLQLLARQLFTGKKRKLWEELFSYSVMFLFAINPWHIYLTRLGHEVNAGFTTVLFGVWLFMEFVYSRQRVFLIGSSVLFSLSFYTYQSQKLVTPLTVLVLGGMFFSILKKHWKDTVLASIIGALITLPIVYVSLQPQALTRFAGTSAFVQSEPLYEEELFAYTSAVESGDVVGRLWHNRRLTPVKIATRNYLLHFKPVWLFAGDRAESHKIPYTGLFYAFEIFLLADGVVYMLLRRKKYHILIVLFALLSPLPAAVTTQAPHAMRSFTLLPWLLVIEGFGIVYIATLVSHKVNYKIVSFLLLIAGCASVLVMYPRYFQTFPTEQSNSFQYALADAMRYIGQHKDEYSQVVVDNRRGLHQSYMFYLYYNRYDPQRYLASGGTTSGGYAQTHTIDTVEFRPVEKTEGDGHTLYVTNTGQLPEQASLLQTVYNLQGEKVIDIGEIR